MATNEYNSTSDPNAIKKIDTSELSLQHLKNLSEEHKTNREQIKHNILIAQADEAQKQREYEYNKAQFAMNNVNTPQYQPYQPTPPSDAIPPAELMNAQMQQQGMQQDSSLQEALMNKQTQMAALQQTQLMRTALENKGKLEVTKEKNLGTQGVTDSRNATQIEIQRLKNLGTKDGAAKAAVLETRSMKEEEKNAVNKSWDVQNADGSKKIVTTADMLNNQGDFNRQRVLNDIHSKLGGYHKLEINDQNNIESYLTGKDQDAFMSMRDPTLPEETKLTRIDALVTKYPELKPYEDRMKYTFGTVKWITDRFGGVKK